MFQKFYKDTLFGRFIKSLLAQSRIPVCSAVSTGDYILENITYSYGSNIIRCRNSGVLGSGATYKIVKTFNESDVTISETFMSETNYYDSKTHKHLGKYLRYLRSRYNLDLLPYYNCYDGEVFSDIELAYGEGVVDVDRKQKTKYKVLGVPIQFGKTYKIHIDSDATVLMDICFHNELGKLENVKLENSRVYASCSFDKPISYLVPDPTAEIVNFEKYMYLVIQVPQNNNSSLVVLEDTESDVNSSLCMLNYRESFAFSDRLVEYLLNNVVTSQDTINRNIEKIQKALIEAFPDDSYSLSFKENNYKYGHWDPNLRDKILDLVNKSSDFFVHYDQDGFVNKDVEQLLESKGVNY